jgi:ribonuclease HII
MGGKVGQPAYDPTPEQRKMVNAMASVGVPQEEISTVLGIDSKTLRKHFREELDTALIKANAKVAANLFTQATKDDFRAAPAAMFWAKTRMGWREKLDVNVTGSVKINFDNMTDEELDEFIASREDS